MTGGSLMSGPIHTCWDKNIHITIYVFQLLHHMMDGVQHMMDRGTSYDGTVPLKGKYQKKNGSDNPSMDSFTKIYIDFEKL